MKRHSFKLAAALLLANGVLQTTAATHTPDTTPTDTTRMEDLQEVVVQGVRAQKDAPYAVSNIKKKELQAFSKTGRELPFLFSQTPGVLAWSENGLGIGTTYMRIRGAGDSRINVTIDGMPLNSPEDQCVFWANMNSYASLLGSVQIQRGVGTSTNGDGAFGGTIALSTKTPDEQPSAEISASYGSYNTFNIGGAFSTGLIGNHLIFDGAYHETNTDGYIHGTSGRSGSYYGGLTYYGQNFVIRYKNIGNFEKTGQAWNGVTAGNDDLSIMDGTYGEKTGIKTYKDMYKMGLGRFNSLYEEFVFNDDGSYYTRRYTLRDGTVWEKATDNFWQNHNILSAAWNINPRWKASASLRYTHGYGYYREFKHDYKLKKFGISPFTDAEGNYVERTDFIRKKGLRQNCYGAVANVSYQDDRWDVIGGVTAQLFRCNHFGYLTYIAHTELENRLLANGNYQYYDSDADKDDYSTFLKAAFSITPQWKVFADAQYRRVRYTTDGVNDKFIKQNGTYVNQRLDIDKRYNFFNPKAGVSYQQGPHHAYASVALSHREPERNNFTDNGAYPAPRAEKLIDYEAGYQYTANRWHAGFNLYYMDYTDQFVQTGAVSDIGEKLTTNIRDSYRMGIELTAGADITPWLSIEGNAALSQNKLKDFDEFVEDWDDWEGNTDAARYHCDGNGDEMRQLHYSKSTLAFSPSTILNGFINLHHGGFQAIWHTSFVSRQYLDNTENSERSLPCYSVSNLNLSYTSKVRKALGIKEVIVGLNFNNVFSRRYAASGWVYSAIAESAEHYNSNRYYQIGFTPMAGFTALGHVTLKF
ncbi:MAG: TonB-dependent receptor [Prevotella sp.]|nr:TonB-dependent receptor [Prevotella sp.]